ncbi:hypothetical protein BCR39DRAFT_549379 [Naematelia encephala]|uniref:Secreted protein n=1 Tax=Naematelia encephala TaxID=71784 RepID=A0A1Y2ALI9_9TREE|nr:hypothetical protein BCR39DRAFT_549379 [Naematelia encephala]
MRSLSFSLFPEILLLLLFSCAVKYCFTTPKCKCSRMIISKDGAHSFHHVTLHQQACYKLW